MTKKLIALLTTALFLISSQSPASAQNSTYRLEPSEKEVVMSVSDINTAYGINVLLFNNDQLLMNQAGISYQWRVSNPQVISISDSGFDSGCPYDIYSPCPNLHATIKGLKPGNSKITVDAYLYDQFLSATNFSVTIKSENFTLEPSENVVETQIHRLNEGYGLNVKLLRDGQLVYDQSDISYSWIVSQPIINLSSYGMSDACPYGVNSPCPNLHADFKATKVGETQVNVTAYRFDQAIAKARFNVIVEDAYTIDFIESQPILEKGIDYPFLVVLKKNGEILPYIQDVRFEWLNSTGSMLWIRDHQLISGCPNPLTSPCSNISATIRGTEVGNGSIIVVAKTEDGVQLTKVKKTIEVIPAHLSYPTGTPYPIPTVAVIPIENAPYPTVAVNLEGERRLGSLEEKMEQLKQNLEEQQVKLQQQESDLEQQRQKLKETGSLLQKIWDFLLTVFR